MPLLEPLKCGQMEITTLIRAGEEPTYGLLRNGGFVLLAVL